MPNVLETDERAYRTCILYEVLHKHSIEKAHDNMKKVIENIDFPDFEYWYYRFLSGERDLDHDRSKDPKTRAFSDMPFDVVEKVVGKLEVMDRLSLRKVSRNLRSVVDATKTDCKSIYIRFSQNISWLNINSSTIYYNFEKEGFCSIQKDIFFGERIFNGLHWELAINDLSSFLINPNWKFGTIEIDFNMGKTYREQEQDDAKRLSLLESILSSNSSKIHAEKLEIQSGTLEPAVTLLPYFHPNTIKSMKFWSDKTNKRHLKQIMKMDHWKMADELHFKRIPDWFDIQLLFHTRKFSIYICDMSDVRIRTVRDVLLKSKTLEWCSLGIGSNEENSTDEDDFDEDLDALCEKVEEIMEEDPAYSDCRYNVEGAGYYFQMRCERWDDTVCLDIRKKSISD
ncbi:unnamed protein product [Caenorhabditis brenneri]